MFLIINKIMKNTKKTEDKKILKKKIYIYNFSNCFDKQKNIS